MARPELPAADQPSHRKMPAWAASVFIHAGMVLLLGWVLVRTPPGAAEQPGRTVGIVLKNVTADGPRFEGEDDQEQDGESGQLSPSDTEALLEALPAESAASSAEQLPELPTIGPGAAEQVGVGTAESMLQGGGPRGRSGLPGGAARVNVFGAEGVGNRFLYIFDRSSSMEGSRLAAAKRELIESLDSLNTTHQFHIIFFNSEPSEWDITGGQNRIAFASDANKKRAIAYVNNVVAVGGTNRRAAMLKGLAFGADVIFFLSDENIPMSRAALDRIQRRNRGRTAINVIEFGRGPRSGENSLEQLAHENGGQYVYVDTRGFERR